MKKTRELRGMPVLALQEGERLGQVRDLILDPAARQVVALILDRRVGGEDQVVATANIHNIGPAAITVEDRSSLIPLSRIPRFQELARMGKPIQGKMVISEAGVRLGKVDDLEIDVQTFRLTSLVLQGFLGRGQVVSADLIRTIGTDAIVVCEQEPAGGAPVPPAFPIQEPAPPPGPFPDPETGLSIPTPAPIEGPAPVLEPVPDLAQEPVSVATPTENTSPSASVPAGPSAEPTAALLSAEDPAPNLEPGPTEGPAAEEGENAWQRWVRRLKNG